MQLLERLCTGFTALSRFVLLIYSSMHSFIHSFVFVLIHSVILIFLCLPTACRLDVNVAFGSKNNRTKLAKEKSHYGISQTHVLCTRTTSKKLSYHPKTLGGNSSERLVPYLIRRDVRHTPHSFIQLFTHSFIHPSIH